MDNEGTIGANSSLDASYIITVNSMLARDFLGNDKAIHKHLRRQDDQGSKHTLKTSKFSKGKKKKPPKKTFLMLNISNFN